LVAMSLVLLHVGGAIVLTTLGLWTYQHLL
jgi:hypothetical protein